MSAKTDGLAPHMTDTLSHVRDLIGDRLFQAKIFGEGPDEQIQHRCIDCGGIAEQWWDITHTEVCPSGILIDTINAFEDPE